jgi:hypothetical protein
VGIRCADHATLYPLKLALTTPAIGRRSVGIVRSRTETTDFFENIFITDCPNDSLCNKINVLSNTYFEVRFEVFTTVTEEFRLLGCGAV